MNIQVHFFFFVLLDIIHCIVNYKLLNFYLFKYFHTIYFEHIILPQVFQDPPQLPACGASCFFPLSTTAPKSES